ncbi:Sarcosine/dimethylglycine N-methyltransferase [Mycobacterium talmoniae]|uniref:Sarcosine/dimethylglycine N-methyltransferase n=1 Tax=Mycobacterium talmoniae TaxID=1858794 RepID=A0A2S8BNE9_9MYCO|nr:Sarcosine/dimethylglycine N-methyltransferase [Mycobacterium talmoniae]
MTEPLQDAREFWEQFYAENERVWSGRANARLVEVASALSLGRALDLGCGEGGDAVWLAEQGWRVLAVDVSTRALDRARAVATERNVVARIDFACHDLSDSFPDGRFDLVSAQFLHSTARLDRATVLRRAADAVAVGGTLLIVDHAAAPPWAGDHARDHEFPTIAGVLAALRLDDAHWTRLRAERADRRAVGPDGQVGTLADNVFVLRRTG